ncbi:hypothetical protein EDB19DRAFT_1677846 [Suillus lakei]|nr:hypothetical protein EDB19DRAFT_1677846 [Suillus lakei]
MIGNYLGGAGNSYQNGATMTVHEPGLVLTYHRLLPYVKASRVPTVNIFTLYRPFDTIPEPRALYELTVLVSRQHFSTIDASLCPLARVQIEMSGRRHRESTRTSFVDPMSVSFIDATYNVQPIPEMPCWLLYYICTLRTLDPVNRQRLVHRLFPLLAEKPRGYIRTQNTVSFIPSTMT